MKKNQFTNIIKSALTVLISVLVIFTVVKANTDTFTPPSGTPTATMYTLTDIYRKLTENATFTAIEPSGRSFTFSDALGGTHYTLTQIYGAIPTINASKVLSDTTYLGVTGSISNCGSEGSQSCYATGTYFAGTKKTLSADSVTVNAGYYDATTLSAVDADLTEGYIKKNTAIFGITGTLYGDTDSTKVCSNASAAGTLTIDASKVLSSATYCGTGGSIANCSSEGGNACYAVTGYWTSLAGSNVTGADGSISFSIPNGYYSSKTCTAQDSYLVTGNIRSTVTIFGVAGNSNVVDTSSGNAVAGEILSGQKCWVDGGEVTGSISNCGSEGSQSCYTTGTYYAGTSKTPISSTTSQSAGYYPAFDLATVDTDLALGNIKKDIAIFGVTGQYPSATYPLPGDTAAGDAAAGNITSGLEAWTKAGALLTGSMANVGQQIITPSTTNLTITAGYHDGTGYTLGDADLVVGKIKSGIDLFGVVGDYPSATYTLLSASATSDLAQTNLNATTGTDYEWWKSDGTYQTAKLDFPGTSNVCDSDTVNGVTGALSITGAYVSVGNTYCGTPGTLFENLFNGSLGAGGFPGGAWDSGGVDDYNNNNLPPSDTYDVNWVTCNIGNHYCGLGDTETYVNGFKMDPATRIVWSDPCTGTGCDSFQSGLAYNGVPTTNYEWCGDTSDPGCSGLTFDDNDNLNDSSVRLSAQELCTSGDHGKSGWYLPHQKMLMQAYIDGCWGNLSGAKASFWSATTKSYDTGSAWYVGLFNGSTYGYAKSGSHYVRCGRLAGDF